MIAFVYIDNCGCTFINTCKSSYSMLWFQTVGDAYSLNMLNAITKQPKATNGLNLSPMRANFQNTPNIPVFLLSKSAGVVPCTYVHVQMSNKIT